MLTKSNINTTDFKSDGTCTICRQPEGIYTSNVATDLYVLTNKNGTEAAVTNFGARLVSMVVKDANGEFKDVVLGYSTLKDYLKNNYNEKFFGAVVGRYANRISYPNKGITNKSKYYKPENEANVILHGGPCTWSVQTFDVIDYDKENASITMQLISPDGDMGFEGQISFTVTYTLDDEDRLSINYRAITTKPSILNVTNHSYFNLSGDATTEAIDHFAFINSRYFTPNKPGALPTGEIWSIDNNSCFDFYTNNGKIISTDMNDKYDQIKICDGYDHNFIFTKQGILDAALADFKSGIYMLLNTDQPAMQLYTAYHFDESLIGKGNIAYKPFPAVCFETQHYADSPNYSHFPTCKLKPGETFNSTTTYKFGTMKTTLDKSSKEEMIDLARYMIENLK